MTKNVLLKMTIAICNILRGFLVFSFLGLTVVFIYLQIDKSYFDKGTFNFETNSGGYSLIYKWKDKSVEDYSQIYKLNKIKMTSLYRMYLKLTGILVVLFLCVKEFSKVIKSVKQVETFGLGNVKSFRRLGVFILIYAFLTSYYYIGFEQGGISKLSIPFVPLFLVLLSFVMAEIFKEGVLLKQENDLTI
ncbi:DUF2975 domain-containing protein [Aestuariibaculum marinum]|uniref:DUF2975 domain-containing protein n=1 Tax=Aestuariibaculum marinum TaxID=2683592 RepID=A0A8J6U3X8_9FLAO|nr:DUF2975 domain-containing protein [Aestuariibaculum marinum]MBD0823497.1 DUF2975 domain-containing protein [Aestuariibaculum marinum]